MQAWRYPEMLSMVEDGTLTPDVLVTERLSLTEGVDHLMRMDTFPGTGFTVIDEFTPDRGSPGSWVVGCTLRALSGQAAWNLDLLTSASSRSCSSYSCRWSAQG